jgi:lantibiotic modifying enzyme
MSSFEAYKSKLFELMSKAYKNENFKFILECEMNQMLNGDVPFFNLNSLNCHLEEDKSFKIFTNNCIENIRLRISLFSTYHKEEQLKYITSWLNI